MKYARDLTDLVGNTPLLRLNKVVSRSDALFLVKFEQRNPGMWDRYSEAVKRGYERTLARR